MRSRTVGLMTKLPLPPPPQLCFSATLPWQGETGRGEWEVSCCLLFLFVFTYRYFSVWVFCLQVILRAWFCIIFSFSSLCTIVLSGGHGSPHCHQSSAPWRSLTGICFPVPPALAFAGLESLVSERERLPMGAAVVLLNGQWRLPTCRFAFFVP